MCSCLWEIRGKAGPPTPHHLFGCATVVVDVVSPADLWLCALDVAFRAVSLRCATISGPWSTDKITCRHAIASSCPRRQFFCCRLRYSRFLADHTQVTAKLLVWVVICLSVTGILWLNGARCGLGCYWSLIGSRILAFKWHENRRPWMTLKVTDNQYGRLS